MPKAQYYKLPLEQILKLRLPSAANRCLIKILLKNYNDRTEGGIWKISQNDTDWNPASHAERFGEVVLVPDKLFFIQGKIGTMPWKTEIQIKPGMIVWFDYLDGLNASYFTAEDGTDYALIDYQNLYVAKDGDKVTPLNGYHLFERVNGGLKSNSKLILEEKVDTNYGIVKYPAKLNDRYESEYHHDIELEEGDKVLFAVPYEVLLEDEIHAKFDGSKMYRRAQSKDVMVVWHQDEVHLNSHIVIVKPVDVKRERPSGLILINNTEQYSVSEVFMSSYPGVEPGDTLYYGKNLGIEIEIKGEKYKALRQHEIIGKEE